MHTQTKCHAHKGIFFISLGCLALLALSAPACDPDALDNFDDVDELALAESEAPLAALETAADPEPTMHDGFVDDPPLEHPGNCARHDVRTHPVRR